LRNMDLTSQHDFFRTSRLLSRRALAVGIVTCARTLAQAQDYVIIESS
jgi:hypothetical protein